MSDDIHYVKLSIKPHSCMCGKPCVYERAKELIKAFGAVCDDNALHEEDTSGPTPCPDECTGCKLRLEIIKWEKD